MKRISLYSILLLGITANAQFNLVPNASFEQYIRCPNNYNQLDTCIGWYNVLNSPDYFNTCSPYPVSIPDNFVGYQFPFDGNAYIGIITYNAPSPWREIVGSQLFDNLLPGNNYHVSMRVSRGNWTNQNYCVLASNKIGMRFTTYPYSISNPPAINNYAQLYTDSIINDTVNWVLLSWNFIADSVYKYVYIGNFFTDAMTDTISDSGFLGQFGIAYYFVDDININCMDENCTSIVSSIKDEKTSLVFNPNSKTLYLSGYRRKIATLQIFNSNGQVIMSDATINTKPIDLSELPIGIYIAMIKTDTETFSKKIIIN